MTSCVLDPLFANQGMTDHRKICNCACHEGTPEPANSTVPTYVRTYVRTYVCYSGYVFAKGETGTLVDW